MNKEEAIIEFIKGLRIVFNNASAYSKDHPFFLKSVEEFKEKVDALLQELNPIAVGIGLGFLFIDGKRWDKAVLYTDLAQLLHFRKIKSITIKRDVTTDELVRVLGAIAQPARDLLRQGGVYGITAAKDYPHIVLEELDYSSFLKGEGEEVKEVWTYIFARSAQDAAQAKTEEIADHFDEIIAKFNTKDFTANDELRNSIYVFLQRLKEKDKAKFYQCTKAMLRVVLKGKGISAQDDVEKVKAFFRDISKSDISETLLDTMDSDEASGQLGFLVFSRLFDDNEHREIAPVLESALKGRALQQTSPRALKKIKELFFAQDSSVITPFYRHVLDWITKQQTVEAPLFLFDHGQLRRNYRYLLFNILAAERDAGAAAVAAVRFKKEYEALIKAKNIGELGIMFNLLHERFQSGADLPAEIRTVYNHLCNFIENAVFEENVPGIEEIIAKVEKSSLGLGVYLEKMFSQNIVSVLIMRCFFRFFPQHALILGEYLKKKEGDLEFTTRFIHCVRELDVVSVSVLLRSIYDWSGVQVKAEILRAMQVMPSPDWVFLQSVLSGSDFILQKEALIAIARNKQMAYTVAQELLLIPSPLGFKNKVIMRNIALIREVNLVQAKEYLAVLGARRFFWNKNVRDAAGEVLRQWL